VAESLFRQYPITHLLTSRIKRSHPSNKYLFFKEQCFHFAAFSANRKHGICKAFYKKHQ